MYILCCFKAINSLSVSIVAFKQNMTLDKRRYILHFHVQDLIICQHLSQEDGFLIISHMRDQG